MKKNRRGQSQGKKRERVDSFKVTREETLLVWLQNQLPEKSRKLLKAVLRDGQVRVDGRPVSQFDHPLLPGKKVEISWDRRPLRQVPEGLRIVHEDQALIVIDKPPGLLTVATGKEKKKTAYAMVSSYVKNDDPENRIFVVHRLDRETSGLLLFAKTESCREQLLKTWRTTVDQRTYVGVVEGEVARADDTVVSWLEESRAFIVYSSRDRGKGKKAVTHYEKIAANKDYSLLKITPKSGRKHQIRVHMQDIGHPVIGDSKYGSKVNPIRRMGLHAQVLVLNHPETGHLHRFTTEIPEAFQKLFAARTQLRT